jgi:hypothetical protein
MTSWTRYSVLFEIEFAKFRSVLRTFYKQVLFLHRFFLNGKDIIGFTSPTRRVLCFCIKQVWSHSKSTWRYQHLIAKTEVQTRRDPHWIHDTNRGNGAGPPTVRNIGRYYILKLRSPKRQIPTACFKSFSFNFINRKFYYQFVQLLTDERIFIAV